MTRVRLAAVLGVVAVLAVLLTGAVAVATYLRDDGDTMAESRVVAEPMVVTDPASGATFEVPARDWEVRARGTRIYYADPAGRPTAVVRGPAVFRSGYCTASPKNSSRGFAGFTRQPFPAWVGALGSADSESVETVSLADGSTARLRWARVHPDVSGPCAAPEVYVAMVLTDDVRVVAVADARAPGTLTDDQIEEILRTLALSSA